MTESTLALEHALTMLLLVVRLLSARGAARPYAPWVILVGLALTLWTPAHAYRISWPLLSALVLPVLLWHVAVQLSQLRPTHSRRSWLLWLVASIGLGSTLVAVAAVSVGSALLLGMVSASLLMGQFRADAWAGGGALLGQLVLALLLAEVDVLAHGARPFIVNVVAGVSLGMVLGFTGVRRALHLRTLRARNSLCLAVMYGGYLVSPLLEVSAVVVALAAGLVLAEYGDRAGLWPTRAHLPEPLTRHAVFGTLATAFIFLGWQAHAPLTTGHLTVIAPGLAVLVLGSGLVWHTAPRALSLMLPKALPAALRVLLLLGAALLLWPATAADVPPSLLGLALLGALVGMGSTLAMVHGLFDLFGVSRRRRPATPYESVHVFDGRERGETIRVWLN